MRLESRVRSEALYFALAFFFFAMAVFGGHLYSGDGQAYIEVALDLVTFQSPTISTRLDGFGVTGIGGQYYAKFGIGYSLLLIPFVFVVLLITLLQNGVITGPVLYASGLLSGPIIGGIGIFYFHLLQDRLGFNQSQRIAGTVFLLMGGLWLCYSRFLFSELSVGVCLILVLLGVVSEHKASNWLIGLASALAVLIRIETVVIVLPMMFLKWLNSKNYLGLLAPMIFAGLVIGYYNWIRFGNPFFSGMGNSEVEAFSTPILLGFLGQFVAPGNGLFVYLPYLGVCFFITILFLVDTGELLKPKVWVLLLGGLLYVLIHSAWHSWMGGWSWGPRRMIPLLPLLHLGVGYAWKRSNKFLKIFLICLLGLAMTINIAGLVGNFNDYYRGTFYSQDVLFSLENSQIIQQSLGLLRGQHQVDNFWLQWGNFSVGLGLILVWCLAGLLFLFRAFNVPDNRGNRLMVS